MPKQQKDAMVALIKRCDDVVSGEVELLEYWVNHAQDPGSSDRCLKRAQRIDGRSGAESQRILSVARLTTPAGDVCTAPNADHEADAEENEWSLDARAQKDVDRLSGPLFQRFLERCERNAQDAVKDARAIYRDCHCSGARP